MSDDEIFCAAIENESKEEQRACVETLCGDNAEQFQRIWSLLETHHKMHCRDHDSQSILDRPDLVFRTFSDESKLAPGKLIGNYVLCELIGEGATSLVFRARQTKPIERDVALKILKPGMDSQRILARFSLEHQVINRLEHAGITTVFDVGVQDNGRPFFAMELVPSALTITQYAERFQLSIQQRIDLLIATCEIIQHAHQRGIIHRDLKPTNILIEGVPQDSPSPRIIDFGIAKVMQPGDDSSSVTTIGDRFGTPAYMSPEQALMSASSIDIRSDVYSLGVLLYELITGSTPRDASLDSAIEYPWTSEAYWQYTPLPPSRVQESHSKLDAAHDSMETRRSIRQKTAFAGKSAGGSMHELDLIVLKSIAKDREDRYQTVADLQRDLQRFRNGEPVEAVGPGLLYRLKKWIVRNRGISTAVGGLLITIVITSILTTYYAFRTRQAEQQVRNQLQATLNTQKEVLLERDRAKEAMRQSQSLLRVLQVQSVTDRSLSRFLQKILESAQRGEIGTESTNAPAIPIEIEVLTKPHDRLIVRGDWTWTSSRLLSEIINTSFKITSREAAKAWSPTQNTLPADQSNSPAIQSPDSAPAIAETAIENRQWKNRESFQHLLLEELRLVLPQHDPFIAEVLDNCGLQALDKNRPDEAEAFLSESVQIWEESQNHLSNLAQSELFLAEAYLRQGKHSLSDSMLSQADQTLGKLGDSAPHSSELRSFYRQLQAELSSQK
ncbi:MAG: serine/threonine-protein kinase [Pirellula sp.]|nr:serine/threonine-protein kinase [Pirellula sp.]